MDGLGEDNVLGPYKVQQNLACKDACYLEQMLRASLIGLYWNLENKDGSHENIYKSLNNFKCQSEFYVLCIPL